MPATRGATTRIQVLATSGGYANVPKKPWTGAGTMVWKRTFAIMMASGAMALGVTALGAGASGAQQAVPAAPVVAAKPLTIHDFVREAAMSKPVLSPDGKRLAWTREHAVVVYNRETQAMKELPSPDNKLDHVQWVNNDYFVVYIKGDEEQSGNTYSTTRFSPLVMTKDNTFVRELFARDGKTLSRGDLRLVVGFTEDAAPLAVTVGPSNVFLTDVATGKFTVGAHLMPGFEHYFDRHGGERVSMEVKVPEDTKINYGYVRMYLHYRAEPDGRVQDLTMPKQDHLLYLDFRYAQADHAIVWTQFDDAKGELQIWRFDMATGEKTLVKTDNNKQTRPVIDRSGHLAGFAVEADRVETQWTDPGRVQLVAAVQKIFPKATVNIADMTEDGKVVVFLISAPDAPDSYYLYDTDAKSLDEIGTQYPELEDKPLGEMSFITYKARDGLQIPAYVVKLKDTPANAPLVVMPHGGPAARDVYTFNFMAEYLASKGYVVLEPQYRGSYGFGDAFQQAGNKHLAQMTTDLEDGVRYLAAQGTIDPKKVCIFGWSWGGYLTQAALAFTPKTYVCGVSGDGVADLFEVLDESNDFFFGGYGQDYWRSVIGQPLMDAAMIHATSPIEHVDAIQAPLLLIHGSEDYVVSKHQSEHMNAAMLKAGKTVTYLPIQYMHHGPEKYSERMAVMTAVDDFIAKAFAKVDTTAAGK